MTFFYLDKCKNLCVSCFQFKEVPDNYKQVYLEMSRRGARVLALGWKELPAMSPARVKDIPRESLEEGLNFAGFVVISCPLKPDSKAVIKEILNASHQVNIFSCLSISSIKMIDSYQVAMITGDNPLTACHVAKELKFTQKPTLVLVEEGGEWVWESIDQSKRLPLVPDHYTDLTSKFDLCLTGEVILHIDSTRAIFSKLVQSFRVW